MSTREQRATGVANAFKPKKAPDMAQEPETDEERQAREAREEARHQQQLRDASNPQPGDYDYEEKKVKRGNLQKLGQPMDEAKSMDYEAPEESPEPSASPEPMPAHRRRKVIVPGAAPKKPSDLW